MLSARSNLCLKREIEFLKQDLNRLYLELGIHYEVQPFYPQFYNTVVEDIIEKKKILYGWKRTRLEALEMFAHAQSFITDMEHPQYTDIQGTFHNPRYQWRRQKPRNKNVRAICPSSNPQVGSAQNTVQKVANKENQRPPSKQAPIQTSQDNNMAVRNIKTENDSEESIALSIAETLKNLKKEKVDQIDSVMNSNVNANFVPQLLPAADIKMENVDCGIVKTENRKRKRKSAAERKRAKRAMTQSSSSASVSPAAMLGPVVDTGLPYPSPGPAGFTTPAQTQQFL